MPTGAQLFVDAIIDLGFREIFTLVGDHLNEVLACAGTRDIRIVDLRHESGVTHAAELVARQRRRPALSLVTGGPGHTNSLTGIATAHLLGSPLVAVSGAAATGPAGRQVFQVIDQLPMVKPVVKWAAQPTSAAQIPYYVGRACAEAMAGRPGPVHLTIPVDVFAAEADKPLRMPLPAFGETGRPVPSPACVDQALTLLEQAERPVVIAGSGLWWSDAGRDYHRFLNRTKLPHYSINMARGLVSDGHARAMGFADPALNRAVLKAFPAADWVLVLGKRLDWRLTLGGPPLFSPESKFIQVDIYEPELGNNRHVELGICADLRETLAAMNDAIGDSGWEERQEWVAQLRRDRDEWRGEVAKRARDSGTPIHPAAFFCELKKHLPSCLFAWDGGEFVHWGRVILPAERPGGWVRLGPMATIGAGLPNAIGMQMANPSERILAITGDGSLGFYIAELDSLVRHGLPIVIIVGNDGSWGVERELQGGIQGTTVACDLRRTRYDEVMKGFGGQAEHITQLDEVGPAVQRAFASGEPYLLNVEIRAVGSPFTEWAIARKTGRI